MEMASLLRFRSTPDYSLVGPESKKAVASGLASGNWYKTPIERKQLKALMQRRDGPALRDTAIWLGLLAVLCTAGELLSSGWWAVPILAVYGVVYASAADSCWHECGCRTAFRTT